MQETRKKLVELIAETDRISKFLNLEKLKEEIAELEKETMIENFWQDKEKAGVVSKELANKKSKVEKWENIKKNLNELLELSQLINVEKTPEEAEEVKKQTENYAELIAKESVVVFFSGKYDQRNAIVSFHVGTGGVDAQDFAEMLLRMYLRYAEKRGWKTKILDQTVGEEAGIKSATVEFEGEYAYGLLKNEMGVHRLVRLSPFNSKNTRETSFAMVEVLPELGEEHKKIEIDKKDLRIEVCRASGHGGQGVNKTDSAVRIVHIPTNLVAQCQNERSQLQNKEYAMKILKMKLLKMMEEKRAEDISKLKGEKVETSFGHQIRSYVLHPYKMVKDHRTNFETGNTDAILDGNLDVMLEFNLEKIK